MKYLKIALLVIAAITITALTISWSASVPEPKEIKSAMVTFTVDESNALIASGMAEGSNDLYADDIYGDCYVYFTYNGALYAPEVEHVFNNKTGKYMTETRCYNTVLN